MTIEDIDREIEMLVERHSARLGDRGRAMLGAPPRKQYDWQFYAAYEKLSHFRDCIDIVMEALDCASSAHEDFNREGRGRGCVNVLAQSHTYQAKIKDQAYPQVLKELEYLIRIPYSFGNNTSNLLKRIYLTYEDTPAKIFYWNGYLTNCK